jgi:integrase
MERKLSDYRNQGWISIGDLINQLATNRQRSVALMRLLQSKSGLPTTTKNSKPATLLLHSYLIELLKEWKDKHPDSKQNDRILRIPTSNSSFLKVLNRDLEFAGIEKTDDVGRVVHLHALRHSFACLLTRKGVHPHVLQRLARYSDIQTTMNLYTHLLQGDDVSAIKSLKQPKKERKNSKRNRAVG